jgi:hypothetical protein
LKVRDDAAAFAVADRALRVAVKNFGERGQEQLREADVHPARQKGDRDKPGADLGHRLRVRWPGP